MSIVNFLCLHNSLFCGACNSLQNSKCYILLLFQFILKMCSKQEARRKQIYEFYLDNRSEGKKYTIDHFRTAKIPRQTISDIIKRAENDSGYKRVNGSGRVAKIMTKANIKRLKTMFDHRDGISTRQAARKFKCS